MKMDLVLGATIIFCLLPLSASQVPDVISASSDMTAIPGDTRTFTCTFIGHSVPYWVVNGGDSPVTITQGNTVSFFTMSNILEIVEAGTVAQLAVSVDLSLNGTTYVCQIDIAGPSTVSSDPAKLTVFGPPDAPNAINSRERYRSVRVGWEKPWSSDLAPVTSYLVQLLDSDGTVLEIDTVGVGSTTEREKTFDNLIDNTDYKARVAAVNSVGQGPWSNEVTFKTPFPDLPTGGNLSTTASLALPPRPTASSETVGSCQTTVTVLSVLLSLVLTLLLFTCAVSAVVVVVMYKRLQRGRAEQRGGRLGDSVKASPEGEGPPTREEEEGGEKIKANPAYLSIEMGYKSQEDKYIDVPS